MEFVAENLVFDFVSVKTGSIIRETIPYDNNTVVTAKDTATRYLGLGYICSKLCFEVREEPRNQQREI